jgi:hypothetical protein
MTAPVPALTDNAIVNRLEPATRDAVLICAAAMRALRKRSRVWRSPS